MAMPTSRTGALFPERNSAIPLRHLWQVPVFLAGLFALLGVWLARPLWHAPSVHGIDEPLAGLRVLLDEPAADPARIVAEAQSLLVQAEQHPQRAGEFHYLLGRALIRAAGREPAGEAGTAWQKARTHLEEAERLGVPAGDQPRLRYQLAQVWLRTGGDKQRILAYLQEALRNGVDDRIEAYRLLAQAHLLAPADLWAALEANAKQLAQPTADERVLAPAHLQRGELLVQLREFAKARESLHFIGPEALPTVLARARFLLARCFQEEGEWREAARYWELVLADAAQPEVGRIDNPSYDVGAIAYDLGMCYRRLPGRAREAAAAWKRALSHGGAHAQAAALRLAELLLQERGLGDALPFFQQALQPVTRPADYANPLIPLKETTALLEQGCQIYRKAGDLARALELAQLLDRLAPSSEVTLLRADILADRAAVQRKPDEGQARSLFLQAGKTYEEALGRGAPAAPALLRSADCYRAGGVPAEVLRVLTAFVRLPDLPERKGEAWFRIAEAHQALGKAEASKNAYLEALKHSSPFEHVARYRLAVLAETSGNLDEAIKQLTLNATLLEQVPEEVRNREVYVQTLVTLGNFLVGQGQQENYHLALRRYTKALELLGNRPEAWPVRFSKGECYRELARRDHEKRAQAVNPDAKKAHEKEWLAHLAAAAEEFEKLEQDLHDYQEAGNRLTPHQESLLDRLAFRIAAARLDRGQFAEALPRYARLAEQHPGSLEELFALEGLAWCHAGLGRGEKVSETLARVQAAAKALPDAVFTGQSEHLHRRYWEEVLPEKLLGPRR